MLHAFRIVIILSFLVTSLGAEKQENHRMLSEVAASGNDWIIDQGQAKPILKPLTWITSRTMSMALFPVCSAIDMTVLTAKQAKITSQMMFDKDPIQRQMHRSQFNTNKARMKKTSLGLIATPFSILSPDIVTHHFVPENIGTYEVVPYGKLYRTRAHMAYPETYTDVQSILIEAARSGKTVSVVGRGMSQGKHTISNQDWNVIINTSRLNKIAIDPLLKTATVGAGVSWKDLQNEANKYGLAVCVMQASNIFSIGGSISANCHGWDHKTGSLRHTLLSVTVVDGTGNVHVLTPEDTLFDYVVGGYGGFGVIVEATLSLTDNLKIAEVGVEIPPSEYLDYFVKNIRDNDAVAMHLYRLSLEPKRLFRTGIAVNYMKVDEENVISNLTDEPERGTRMDRIKIHTLRRLTWLRNLAWNMEKQSALTQKISTRNEIMRPPINPIFNNSKIDSEWLQEYFVKGEELAPFLSYLAAVLEKNKVAVFNASVRFVKHDPKTKLSYAPDGDRYAIVLFFNQKLTKKEVQKTKAWVREVVDYLIAHDGGFYLPYQHFATPEQFKKCYPNWESILAYKQTLDPQSVISNGFYEDYLQPQAEEKSLFRATFDRVNGDREGIRDFLNNIFMQVNEKQFFALVDQVLENPNLSDEQIYQKLYEKIQAAKPNALTNLKQTLRSLHILKNELGDQTAYLVGQRPIKGYVEIGYPGRMIRPLELRLEMKPPFYVVTDQERYSDYIEAGLPLPYDKFVGIGDYEPISEKDIPTESVDLVCMYIGLHHAPEEKLDAFLASIKRILRPGGTFILMDHDAKTEKFVGFVDVVHSIFNVGTGVTPAMNRNEIRHFHSLEYWKARLASHGFIHYHHDPLIRVGDSTLNSLVRFDKSTATTFETLSEEFQRPFKQTYLTAPEWQNVRAAQRYGDFVENQPATKYPYFKEIAGFWKVYGKSWGAAQKESSFQDVALSEYNFMNLFVGTTMTLEYGIKGVIALPFSLFPQGSSQKSSADLERIRSLKAYGEFIENTPFYKYPYFKDIGTYWRVYGSQKKTAKSVVKGFVKGIAMTGEYTLKGLISAPMALVYGSEGLKEAEVIHLLIKDKDNLIESIDPSIVVVDSCPDTHMKHIQCPRYMRFTELMVKISREPSIECVNIAGHDKIQVDVQDKKAQMQQYPGVRKLYDIPAPTEHQNAYCALEIENKEIFQVLRNLASDEVDILFIHDY